MKKKLVGKKPVIDWKLRYKELDKKYDELQLRYEDALDVQKIFSEFTDPYEAHLKYMDDTIRKKLDMILLLMPEHLRQAS